MASRRAELLRTIASACLELATLEDGAEASPALPAAPPPPSRPRKPRQARGWSQQRIADALDLHRPSVTMAELGKRDWTAVEIVKLSRLFGVPVGRLLSGSEG
jgi:DNA-binding XRE family transcriptional regulator